MRSNVDAIFQGVEEKEMITQLEKEILIEQNTSSVFVIIVKDKKEKEILGSLVSEWVADAVKDFSSIIIERDKEDTLEVAKKYLTNSTYTLVLSGNLPLLTKDVINHLVEYATFKKVDACKFMGGGIYNTDYLKHAKSIFYDSVYAENDDCFYFVENAKQMGYATEVLRNRIIDFHISNGVFFKNIKNTIIEKNVVIKKGVVIDSGNTIKGNTVINEGCIIKENNIIENSIISENTCVANSTIVNSKIGDDCIIMPYSNINNCNIGSNVVVFGNISLLNKNIKDNRKIKNKEVNE